MSHDVHVVNPVLAVVVAGERYFIYSHLYVKLPKFKEYLDWYFEGKVAYPVGMKQEEIMILAIDEAQAELFYSTQACNR